MNKVVERLGNGVQREWLEDNLLVYTVSDVGIKHQACVDTWLGAVQEFDQRWESGRVCFVLHDVSDMGFSYYGLWRAKTVQAAAPRDRVGYEALVIPRNTLGLMMHSAVSSLTKNLKNDVKVQTFFDRDKALAWLLENRSAHNGR